MGSVVDSIFGGGDAAEEAADAQIASSQAAIQQQEAALEEVRRQFDVTKGLLDPFRGAGVTALNEMMLLMGLSPGTAGGTTSAPLMTEQQIRQELMQSGRFGSPATGGGRLLGNGAISGTLQPGETPGQAVLRLIDQRKADVIDRGMELRRSGQGLDRQALEAEVARRLAAQQQAGGTTGTPGMTQEDALARLTELPGQRFIRDKAQQALLRASGAIGGLGGGNVRTALVEQGAGFAQQDLQNRFQRLQNLITGGQAAAAGTGAAAQNVGQSALQSSANIGNLLQAGGLSRAQGILGAQQANAQTAGLLGSAGLGAAAGAGLAGPALAKAFGGSGLAGALLGVISSDVNMKTDVRDLTPKECYDLVQMLDIKAWRYLPETGLGNDVHIGPMAQDSPEIIKMPMEEKLNLHSELMLIAGALQYVNQLRVLDELDEEAATCQ